MTDYDFNERFVAARRAYIEHEFARLNDVQREAVLATEGPSLLLAGAGSGKTTVLISRMANLIRYGKASDSAEVPSGMTEADIQLLKDAVSASNLSPEDAERLQFVAALEPAEPWRIMAITFTNKAAGELKHRLSSMLGEEAAADVWAMTFHAACVRILRRDIERVGFASGFTIYDSSDSQTLMKRVIKELNLDDKTFPYRYVLSIISRAKDEGIMADRYLEEQRDARDIRKIRMGEAYKRYEDELRKANAMDFDDLLLYAVKLLRENSDVLSYYQRRFKYILIDEYQDTNKLQYEFAALLAGGHRNICVVGDDDQSIYKFRGATIENILNFEKQYKDARVIRLEQNYRSTGYILKAANSVIANNKGRKGKNLWTAEADGDKLTLYTARDENDEANFVAARILESVKRGEPRNENAVLYRMNAQSNKIEEAFRRNGIPYRVVGGLRFIDRAEVKDMLAYMCVIVSPNDDQRLTRIVNNPPRLIGAKTIETVRGIAEEAGVPMLEILGDAIRFPELSRAAPKLLQFADMIKKLRALEGTIPLDEFYDVLLDKSGYLRMLESKDTDENRSRADNVRELKSTIIGYMRESGENSLSGFLDEILLYSDFEDDAVDTSDYAVMMTMHAAKGLEFSNVYIVGAEENVFPGTRSIGEPEEMEEERRLCYVAITRAKRRLYICRAHQRMLFGNMRANSVSRFINEIPEDYIDFLSSTRGRESDTWSNGDRGGGYTSRAGGRNPAARRTTALTSDEAPAVVYVTGDVVMHKAFGRGVLSDMQAVGGDHLIVIEFGEHGTKRMMLRAASQNMTKVE